jgi:hypothetical protein
MENIFEGEESASWQFNNSKTASSAEKSLHAVNHVLNRTPSGIQYK